MHANPQLGLEPVGFVDDDPDKHGMHIHGVPVLGAVAHLAPSAAPCRAAVIIAMPSAAGKVVRDVRDLRGGRRHGAHRPELERLLDGHVSVSQLRKVEIEDLLRREPVQRWTRSPLRQLLAGKRVLVTGGGGSIGSELCRQVLRCRPAELIILGHGENSVFEIVQELRTRHASGLAHGAARAIHRVIADVRFARAHRWPSFRSSARRSSFTPPRTSTCR